MIAAALTDDDAITCVAMPAPVVDAARLVDAWRDDAVVAWTSRDVTIVGLGVARELRASGPMRWRDIAAQARSLRVTGPVRFLGGGAFAPGAADRAPWQGFGDAWFVLPRWTYVCDAQGAQLVLALDGSETRAQWDGELATLQAAFDAAPVAAGQPAVVELQRADGDEYRRQVAAITAAIPRGACSKIVAARTCTVALAGRVREAGMLAALDARHADCVRLLVRPPGAGTLVAATPERLVRRTGELVECDALAGTRSENADALMASAKDRREHDLVVTAIRAALEDAGATVDAPAEPLVRTLRHVVHLHTPFRAVLDRPRHVLELVERLHPTPAVGGTPTPVAVEWIRTHEPVQRGWYASPVGWFDGDGNGEFAVAIRSGVLAGNRAHLWAGGGIVAGSDPDYELAETELKLRAMLGALGVQ